MMTIHQPMLALFGLPGHWEIVIVILVILLLFGGKKLPELARGLGRGMRVFRNELKGIKDDIDDDSDETPDKAGKQPDTPAPPDQPPAEKQE